MAHLLFSNPLTSDLHGFKGRGCRGLLRPEQQACAAKGPQHTNRRRPQPPLRHQAHTSSSAIYSSFQTAGPIAEAAVLAPAPYTRDSELQAALDALFADTCDVGRSRVLHSEVAHHVERIEALGARLGLDRVRPEWNDGSFLGLVTTQTQGIDTEHTTTMGRLTFSRVRPVGLAIQLAKADEAGQAGAPDQYKGRAAGLGYDNGYTVVSYFQILSNGVLGKMTIMGRYDVDEADPALFGVNFTGQRLQPLRPEDLAAWREALGEANPGMAPDGTIEVLYDKPPRGVLRYILLEPEYHLALGAGSGTLTAMRRVA